MVFTDPPYNLSVREVVGLGAVQHPEFTMASAEMSEADFTAFLGTVMSLLVRHSENGSNHFVCMDWRHIYELLAAAKSVYAWGRGAHQQCGAWPQGAPARVPL